MILLPLCPASVMRKNPEGCKIIKIIMQRLINGLINLNLCIYITWLLFNSALFLLTFVVLYNRTRTTLYILISVYCNTEFWSLSSN